MLIVRSSSPPPRVRTLDRSRTVIIKRYLGYPLISIADYGSEFGCLCVVPGSLRKGVLRMATRFTVILALALVACLRVPAAADSDVANQSETASSEDIWKRDTFTGDWGRARKSLEDAGVTFTVEGYSEFWANLTGGLRTGGAYAGLTDASLKLDLAKLMNWQGATFFVNAYQIHGFGPSANFVGNQQFVSNIEATPSTKLYDLWLEQSLFNDRVSICIRQEGMNDEFMTSKASEMFLNGSFGYPDLNERDLPSSGPNYPLATPMVRAKVKFTDQFSYIGAIFNGDPADLDEALTLKKRIRRSGMRPGPRSDLSILRLSSMNCGIASAKTSHQHLCRGFTR